MNRPPASGFFAGQDGYVEVLISQPLPTCFMPVLGINTMDIGVRAVAVVAAADAETVHGGVTLSVSRTCECDNGNTVDCETGTCTWVYTTLSSVARDATRHAIVNGNRSPAPVDSDDIQDFVNGRLPALSGVTATTEWDPDNTQGSIVKVTVRYDFEPVVGFLYPVTIASTSEMAISF